MKNKILVTGSLDMDVIVYVKTLPKNLETIQSSNVDYVVGGKGLNTALTIARLGGGSTLLGKVGKDRFGDEIIKFLKKEKIDVSAVTRSNLATGIVVLVLGKNVEETLVYVDGANFDFDKKEVDKYKNLISNSKVVVANFGVPVEIVSKLFELSKKERKITILNPSPAYSVSEKLFQNTEILVVNEKELAVYAGSSKAIIEIGKIKEAAKSLKQKINGTLVVTLGPRGALAVSDEGYFKIDGLKVKAVDTTAAGDAFLGALALKLSKGKDLKESLEFANKVAATVVQKAGASISIPYLKDVND